MYCSIFADMESAVKRGSSKEDLNIINYYIVIGLDRAKEMNDINDTKSVHLRIYNTLLNTMCDTCLSMIWRKKCYDYLEEMMPLLSTIHNVKDFKKKKNELSVLYAYFCQNEEQIESPCYTFEIENIQIQLK